MTSVVVKGHPVPPMLVGIPIGLLTFSLVSDVLYRTTGWFGGEMVFVQGVGVGAGADSRTCLEVTDLPGCATTESTRLHAD